MQRWNGSDKTNYSVFHTKQEYVWGEHPAVVSYSSLWVSSKHLLVQVRKKSAAALNCHNKVFSNLLEGSGDLRTRVQDCDKPVKSSYCPFFIKLSFPYEACLCIYWRTASFHNTSIYQYSPPHSHQTLTWKCHWLQQCQDEQGCAWSCNCKPTERICSLSFSPFSLQRQRYKYWLAPGPESHNTESPPLSNAGSLLPQRSSCRRNCPAPAVQELQAGQLRAAQGRRGSTSWALWHRLPRLRQQKPHKLCSRVHG